MMSRLYSKNKIGVTHNDRPKFERKKLRPLKPDARQCPNELVGCDLKCKYNFFESEDLTIHAYELKCLNCGWRETIGFRSDEEEEDDETNPRECPFCNACDLKPGRNPCEG